MHITKKLDTPGDHRFFLEGQVGALETVLTVPEKVNKRFVAIIGHPHPLHGGTMNNKVITTLVRVFQDLHIPSIRFNFRGVLQSPGVFDEGIGESEDMLCIARQWLHELPDTCLLFAGFSFGSYVAYRAAAQCKHGVLITIAPPVHHFDYNAFSVAPAPWIIVQGDHDEIIPEQLVLDFIAHTPANIQLLRFADTSHFFHGKLIELKSRLLETLPALVDLT